MNTLNSLDERSDLISFIVVILHTTMAPSLKEIHWSSKVLLLYSLTSDLFWGQLLKIANSAIEN